ncbi:MAG TPA: hypothetical protein DCZ11_01800, partial [Gammaproteobacteria bacterium]|nr:hypothetical protein [Gammaproteobacteria bacterium]MCH77157.1 hypothetical protein [Gammaproteobacteria bacterium]
MPMGAGRPCTQPGCGRLTESRESRCADHAHVPFGRRRTGKRTYGAQHRQVRAAVFKRDGDRCVLCGSRQDLELDHIDPAGPDSVENGRTLCGDCHATRTARQGHAARGGGKRRAPCQLVCGPPGAGKSSYVRARMRRGELVVDFDELYQALTGLPVYDKPAAVMRYVQAARRALIACLASDHARPRSWVIATAAAGDERRRLAQQLDAAVVVLAVPEGECVARIAADPRRAAKAEQWRPLVRRWWDTFTPGPAEEQVLRVGGSKSLEPEDAEHRSEER